MLVGKITSQRNLFESPFFRFTENTITYDNGLVKLHHDVYRNSGVSILAVTDTHDIFLIKEYRYLYDKFLLEVPAGSMEKGEDVLVAAKRELVEEVGLNAKTFRLLKTTLVAGSFIHAQQHLVLATGLSETEATPEETENITVIKMSLDEAVEKVLSGEIETVSSSVGILLVNELVRKGAL
jgi:ADP-ribose pyrophosphatase